MTIESKLAKNTFIGNASTVIFPFTFKIWEENQILVTVEDPDGFTDTAVPEKITLFENGGEIMLYFDSERKLPYPAGYKIAITRNMPFLQASDYINGSRINTEVIEKDLDIAAAERQQLLEMLSRSLIMAATDERSPEEVLQDFLTKYLDIAAKYPEIITAFNTIYPRIEEVLQECIANKDLANAWAESDSNPEPDDPESHSAKWWAMNAADVVPYATYSLAGKVRIDKETLKIEGGLLSLPPETVQAIADNTAAIGATNGRLDTFLIEYAFRTGDFKVSFKDELEGFLLCDGSAVSRETYADLFAVIGTTFGEGDGSTTFNLPDFRGRFIQGANGDLGSYKEAGLPNITGDFASSGTWSGFSTASGALRKADGTGGYPGSGGSGGSISARIIFDASYSNSVYGKSNTVQPPAVALNVFIKY